MISSPNLLEVYERVDCGKEGSIQPSSPLRYEFRDSI